MRGRYWKIAAVAALLLVMVLQVALSTRQESPSWDEGDHIYSGYMDWLHRDYSLNPEHPPLVKLIATLPLLPLDLKIAPRQGRYFKSEAYYGGRELLFRNDPRYGGRYGADTLLFRIHMAAMLFGLTLALLVFLAVEEMFGTLAGFFALGLFVFDPTILANAPFVATDMGAACGVFAAVYTFYRFIKAVQWQRAVMCGLATGLALGTKHSTVLLLPIFLVLTAGELWGRWRRLRRWPPRETGRLLSGLGAIAGIAIFVLWGVYSFRYAMHPSGTVVPPLAEQMQSLSALTRGLIGFCARFRLLPESYLYGLVDVQRVALYTPTYIFGKIYVHGQWFYFPAILSLKWTVGVIGLLCVAVYAFAAGKLARGRELFFLVAPPATFLAVAIASPLNIGVRHVLPLFPFAFALAGAAAAWMVRRRGALAWTAAALVAWHVVDSVRVFPNYIPYANVLWGGPTNTSRFFSDSATDWAQQLKWTKQWLDDNHVHDCWFAYFAAPFLLPSDYGIPCRPLPTLDSMEEEDIAVPAVVHGPILISMGDLNGFEFGTKLRNPYQKMFERKPDAVIRNAVAVFYGDYALPEAAAIEFEQQAKVRLKTDPAAAVAAAKNALALVPDSFDANVAAGDAYGAAGEADNARAAYRIAAQRVAEMEPSARAYWGPKVEQKLADLNASRNQ